MSKTMEGEQAKKKEQVHHIFLPSYLFFRGPHHYIIRVFMAIREVKHAALPSAGKWLLNGLMAPRHERYFPVTEGMLHDYSPMM